MLFTILGWILFGLIAGFIARAIVPGKDDIGIWRTILLGIVGSFVGGLIFALLTRRAARLPTRGLDRLDHRRGDRPGDLQQGHGPQARRPMISA